MYCNSLRGNEAWVKKEYFTISTKTRCTLTVCAKFTRVVALMDLKSAH